MEQGQTGHQGLWPEQVEAGAALEMGCLQRMKVWGWTSAFWCWTGKSEVSVRGSSGDVKEESSGLIQKVWNHWFRDDVSNPENG